MKRNGLKIYSVIISVIAAALMAAVVVFVVLFTRQSADNAVLKAEIETTTTETTTTETAAAETTTTETTAADETDDKEYSSKKTHKENMYNAGDIVANANGGDESFSAEDVINAWSNTVSKLGTDADIVFFGDSLIERSDFRPYFPDKKIVNFGLGGDKISGALKRYNMLPSINPEKVFIMCGVNELRDENIDTCISEYGELLDGIHQELPQAQIYVESVLPMVAYMQDYLPCHAATTETFNSEIKKLAEEKGMTFVDLYSAFVMDGEMNEALTADGVHLNEAGYDLWAQKINDYIYN